MKADTETLNEVKGEVTENGDFLVTVFPETVATVVLTSLRSGLVVSMLSASDASEQVLMMPTHVG